MNFHNVVVRMTNGGKNSVETFKMIYCTFNLFLMRVYDIRDRNDILKRLQLMYKK